LAADPLPAPPTRPISSLILSDGDHYIQAMLATQLNRFIENGEIEKNSVIRLTSYALNYVSERK
jgi:replication factor A1